MKTVNAILICLLVLVVIAITKSSEDVYPSKSIHEQNVTSLENKITTVSSEKTAGTRSVQTKVSDQFVENCRKFIGTPHKYGGLSNSGLDCSGLLYVNFKSFGLTIPRNSARQSDYFESVEIENTQKGDLLFFGSSEQSISHAGVVAEVDSLNNIRFIHTSTSQGVIEEDLKSDYWAKRLIKICRPDYESGEIAT